MYLFIICKILGEFSKSKISDFDFIIIDENVGNFNIPMDDIFVSEIAESFEDVLNDGFCFVLVEISFFP
jgi:hypothetical protein